MKIQFSDESIAADSVTLFILDVVEQRLTDEEKIEMENKTLQLVGNLAFNGYDARLLAERMFKLGQLAARVSLLKEEPTGNDLSSYKEQT